MNGKLKEHVCQKKGSAKERFWKKKNYGLRIGQILYIWELTQSITVWLGLIYSVKMQRLRLRKFADEGGCVLLVVLRDLYD